MTKTRQIGKTATKIREIGPDTCVRYHNTDVVIFHESRIVLNSGGWRTTTTKRRMNQAADQFDLGYYVYQRNFNWYVDYRGDTLDFYDGIVLKR